METASSTTSFIKKGMLPAIAGKPPAEAAQPFGMKGMMVTVPTNVATDPSAPKTPARLSQKPANSSAPNVHSETPKNQLAPRMPKTGYNHEISGPLLI